MEETVHILNDAVPSVQGVSGSVFNREGGRSSRYSNWPEWITLTVYAALVAFAIPFHEPFVDEAQSWQLARSLSLHDLFQTYLRYEGSPGLWHSLLWILVRLHISYTGIHWICGAIAVLSTAILVLRSPFPRFLKLTLPFTYFLLFQYAVVARNYVLAPILFFLIALCWKRSPVIVALLLGLLANVSLHTAVVSGGLAIVYVLLRSREPATNNSNFRRQLIIGAIILLALYVFSIWTVWPPRDFLVSRVRGDSRPFISIAIGSLFWAVCQPMFLSLPFWAAIAIYLRSRRSLVYLLPVLFFSIFSGVVYVNWWHAGLLIPLLISILWVTWPESRGQDSSNEMICRVALIVMVCTQILWSAYAMAYDHSHAFSPDLEASQFLKPFVQNGATIAITYLDERQTRSFEGVGIQAYFDRKIYLNQRESFWWWSENNQAERMFNELLPSHPGVIVVVTRRPHGLSPNVSRRQEIERIIDAGYTLTNTFCGAIPERFGIGEDSCRLIFQYVSSQGTQK